MTTIKINQAYNEMKNKNCFTITGPSINRLFYVTKIKYTNTLKESEYNSNEGHFNVIIPKKSKDGGDNIYWTINTTLYTTPQHLQNNIISEDLSNDLFPYEKYGIPSEVWITVYGSIYAEI